MQARELEWILQHCGAKVLLADPQLLPVVAPVIDNLRDLTLVTDDYEEFKQIIERRGFARVKWAEDSAAELAIKEETKATLRVIPFDQPEGGVSGKSIYTGKPATCEAIFGRAY